MPAADICIRTAVPNDIPALMRLKWALAMSDNTPFVVTATDADWARDCFGPSAKFTAFLAEHGDRAIGMAVYSLRSHPGWAGPTIYLHDIIVEAAFRRQGVASALLARVARLAVELNAAMIELVVRDDNPARQFYRKLGFERVRRCMTYVAAQPVMHDLTSGAEERQDAEALP